MIIFSQTLYKNKQVWTCEVEDFNRYSVIRVTFGKNGGKLQKKETYINTGKNIGKANQTTHQEQAVLEAKSKVNKQKDKLYIEDGVFDGVIQPLIIRPMLAKSYDKDYKKITFPCYVQPKLDGVRCLFNGQYFVSRQGKQYQTLEHLMDEAKQLFSNMVTETGLSNIWLDGELYTDNLSFQNIISAIKRDEPNTLTPEIQYHIYDAVVPNMDYEDRMFCLRNAFSQQTFKSLINVETYEIDSKGAIDSFHSYYIQQGKEGVMLRNKSGYYTVDKRSHNLQKVKKFDDAEFEIINYKIDKNDHVVFECVTDNGDVFEVKPMGDTETRDMYTDDAESLIGEYLTVKYFGMTTGDNPVPRFPVGVSIRNFEY